MYDAPNLDSIPERNLGQTVTFENKNTTNFPGNPRRQCELVRTVSQTNLIPLFVKRNDPKKKSIVCNLESFN